MHWAFVCTPQEGLGSADLLVPLPRPAFPPSPPPHPLSTLKKLQCPRRLLSPTPHPLPCLALQKPSKQTSKYGDSSVSRLVTVVGVRPIRVASIFQTDPFVLAAVEDTSHTLTSDCPARASRVREVFAECARLRSEIGVEGVGDVDLDNLHAAVELHNGAEVDGRALQVLALAATEGMPAAVRLKALTLSGDDDGEGLFEVVLSALEDDLRRLAALKAIG